MLFATWVTIVGGVS